MREPKWALKWKRFRTELVSRDGRERVLLSEWDRATAEHAQAEREKARALLGKLRAGAMAAAKARRGRKKMAAATIAAAVTAERRRFRKDARSWTAVSEAVGRKLGVSARTVRRYSRAIRW